MKRTSILLAILAAGCTVPQAPKSARTEDRPARLDPAPTVSQGAVDYTYELLHREDTGLVQVFDDGNSTYLRFESQVPAGLMIFDESGAPIAFAVSGPAAVISTVRTGLLLRTPTSRSYAQSRTPNRTARLETYEGVAAGAILPAELASARAEILSSEHRLASLSAELELASRGEPVRPIADLQREIRRIETQSDGLAASLVRTHFASGSASLDLSRAAREALIEAAAVAQRVRIEGGTDATGNPMHNEQLALARAREVRRLLLQGGVAQEKLSLRVATTEYVASNGTREGRAENRRVDVILLPAVTAQVF